MIRIAHMPDASGADGRVTAGGSPASWTLATFSLDGVAYEYLGTGIGHC